MNTENEAIKKAGEILDKSDFIKYLEIEILELDDNHAKGRMPFAKRYCNPFGTMHGGCLNSLADTVAGSLANHVGGDVNTIEGGLSFLEAARNTEYVYCIATLKRCGAHIVSVDVDITDDAGKLLDCGNFNFFRMQTR